MSKSLDFVLYFLAAAVVIGGAFGIYDAVVNPSVAVGGAGETPDAGDPWYSPGRLPSRVLRIVIIGADDREGERGRSDTLMVAFLNPMLKKLAFLSIPRDLRVDIPGYKRDKINHAYADGGRELTVATVRELLSQDIDYSMKINFEGFVKAVDILGGIDITVPDHEGPMTRGRHHGMHYDDNWGNLHIDLEPGRQHLDGQRALGFVRYRHSKWGGAISDLDRAANQQAFLRELVGQKLRIAQVPRLLKAGSQMMGYVDTDIGWLEAVEIFKTLKAIPPSEIYTTTVPMGDMMISGVYYGELRESAFHDELSKINDYLYGRLRTDCPVTVYNGCGEAGIASEAAELLREAGFQEVSTDNAAGFDHKRTSIEYYGDAHSIATRAAQTIGCGRVTEGGQDVDTQVEARVEIIVGEDFKPSG